MAKVRIAVDLGWLIRLGKTCTIKLLSRTPTLSGRTSLHWQSVTVRILAALIGCYGAIWAFCAAGVVLLVTAGIAYEEAEKALHMLAFIVYLMMFLWVFAAKNIVHVWGILLAATGLGFGLAWLLQRIFLY